MARYSERDRTLVDETVVSGQSDALSVMLPCSIPTLERLDGGSAEEFTNASSWEVSTTSGPSCRNGRHSLRGPPTNSGVCCGAALGPLSVCRLGLRRSEARHRRGNARRHISAARSSQHSGPRDVPVDRTSGHRLQRWPRQAGRLLHRLHAALKALSPAERTEVLADPLRLRAFADETNESIREMRHILLHLLRPDDFERISSGPTSGRSRPLFSGLLDESAPADLDERLLAIHTRLES